LLKYNSNFLITDWCERCELWDSTDSWLFT